MTVEYPERGSSPWDIRLKTYIDTQDSTKADASALESLQESVDGKAGQDELDALAEEVGTKADQSALDELSEQREADRLDFDVLQRLDREHADIIRETGAAAAVQYSDSVEINEDWEDLDGVLPATNAQVQDNRLYAVDGSYPGGWQKEVSVPAEGNWRASTVYYHKVGGATKYSYFGINCGAPGAPLATNDPNGFSIGVAVDTRFSVKGSALSGLTSIAPIQMPASNVITEDTDFSIVIEADPLWITFTMKKIDAVDNWYSIRISREELAAAGKTVNNIFGWLTDPRGLDGSSFGPWILQTDTLQPPRTKVVGGQNVGNPTHLLRPTNTSGSLHQYNGLMFYSIPTGYDPRKPAPLVLWGHHSVTGAGWDPWEEPRLEPVTQRLSDEGYIIAGVCSPTGTDLFGNQMGLDAYMDLMRFIRSNYNIGSWFWYGASMGGLAVANAISRRQFPTPAAAATVGGAFDQGAIWDLGNPYNTMVEAAFDASGRADLLVKSTGYDPIRNAPESYRNVPWRLYTSDGDEIQPPARQQEFVDHIIDHVPEATIVMGTGGHLDPSQYQPDDLLGFFEKYR